MQLKIERFAGLVETDLDKAVEVLKKESPMDYSFLLQGGPIFRRSSRGFNPAPAF